MSRASAAGAAGLAVVAGVLAGVIALRGPAEAPPVSSPGADGEEVPAPPRGACEPEGLPPCAKVSLQYSSPSASLLESARGRDALRELCDKGIVHQCVNLAVTLWTGRDGDKDEAGAVDLLRKACQERDDAVACLDLGVLYDMGAIDSARRDPAESARDLYGKACRAGDGLACSNLGVWMVESADVAVRAEGGPVLEAACRNGWSIACFNLGTVLLSIPGKGGEARAALEVGCEAGLAYAPACTALGTLAERDGADAEPWFRTGCERGDEAACERFRASP